MLALIAASRALPILFNHMSPRTAVVFSLSMHSYHTFYPIVALTKSYAVHVTFPLISAQSLRDCIQDPSSYSWHNCACDSLVRYAFYLSIYVLIRCVIFRVRDPCPDLSPAGLIISIEADLNCHTRTQHSPVTYTFAPLYRRACLSRHIDNASSLHSPRFTWYLTCPH